MTYAAQAAIAASDYNAFIGSTATPGNVLPNLINHHEGITVAGDICTRVNPGATYGWGAAKSNLSFSSGIWYWEATIESAAAAAGSNYIMVGIGNASAPLNFPGQDTNGWGYYNQGGAPAVQNYYRNNLPVGYGAGSFGTGDVIGVLVNMTALTLTFYKNNVSQGAIAITAGTYYPMVSLYTVGNSVSLNLGLRDFAYAMPGGSSALGAEATRQMNTMLSTGYADWGYGQNVPSLTNAVAGTAITAAKWLDLDSAVAKVISHQGISVPLDPPSTDYAAGLTVKANTAPANTAYSRQRSIAALSKSRNSAAAGAMTVYLPTSYGIRATNSTVTWGSGVTNGIYCEALYDFATEENARFFFNSGGELRISLSHSNATTSQNIAWGTILTDIGTIKIGAGGCTRTGTLGYPYGNGYYQMTTTAAASFVGTNIGGGAYSANDVLVNMRTAQAPGANGGRGFQLNVRVHLMDQHTNAWTDTIAPGTICDFGFYKATTYLANIVSPTVTLPIPWAAFNAGA